MYEWRVNAGALVWGRGRKTKGVATGSMHRCQLDGCSGMRVTVRWPDGKITHPCTKGMKFNAKGTLEIL